MEGPFPSLDYVCDGLHLLQVAKKLTQWRTFAPWLGFESACVEALDRNDFDEEGTRQQMLTIWKQRRGPMATYRALAEVLLKTGRTDLAEIVLEFSKVPPKVTSSLSDSFSAESSQHSSYHMSPHPSSLHSTPPLSTVGVPYRSAQPVSTDTPSLLAQKHFSSRQESSQPLQQSVPPQQYTATGQHTPPNDIGVPMQINDQRLDRGSLCMTQGNTAVPFYSEEMIQKINSVSTLGTSYGLPTQNTVAMKQLTHKIQGLELERQNTTQRYERELYHMKLEQQFQRNEYEGIIRLLKQQLQDTQADAKSFESMVGSLTMQLRQMEARFLNSREKDSPDGASPCSSSGCIRADSGEHEYYTTHTCELREEIIVKTVVCSEGCWATADGRGGGQEEGGCAIPETRKYILEEFQQFQLRLEGTHTQMLESLENRRSSETEAHRSAILDANSQMTEVVSQSLECLADCPDSEGLSVDLQWLHQNLEACRLKRHASWP
jgi:hypothetical protein